MSTSSHNFLILLCIFSASIKVTNTTYIYCARMEERAMLMQRSESSRPIQLDDKVGGGKETRSTFTSHDSTSAGLLHQFTLRLSDAL